jgi:hypothetical protein
LSHIHSTLTRVLISIGFPITRIISTTRSAHLAFDDHSGVKVLLHAYNRVAPNHRSRGWLPECGRDFDPAGRRRRRVRDAGNGASNSGITDYLNLGSAKESPATGRKR